MFGPGGGRWYKLWFLIPVSPTTPALIASFNAQLAALGWLLGAGGCWTGSSSQVQSVMA